MEQQTEKKSYRLVWMAVASLAVFFVVLGLAWLLVSQSDKNNQQNASTGNSETTGSQVATKEDVTQSISTLGSSIKQAATDQAAAKAALSDNKNQIKVGS